MKENHHFEPSIRQSALEQTRRDFLERYCERPVQVMTAHFPSPSSGHIHRHGGDSYRFKYFGEA